MTKLRATMKAQLHPEGQPCAGACLPTALILVLSTQGMGRLPCSGGAVLGTGGFLLSRGLIFLKSDSYTHGGMSI